MTIRSHNLTVPSQRLASFAGLLFLVVANRFGAAQQPGTRAPAGDRGAFSLALTFDSASANITTSNSFWLYGGSAELNAGFVHGFGLTAAVTGLHTANSGGGVPINLVAATFGPSYSLRPHFGRHPVTLFAHGLIGEVNGFDGVYPKSAAPDSSANGFAAQSWRRS